MKYYTKFDETNYSTGIMNTQPEDMTGVYEFDESLIPGNGFRLKLDSGVVRSETEQEHAAELLQLKSLNDIKVKRRERDILLDESDALVLPDRWAGYTPQKQAALGTYRQALRDFPQQAGFPNIDFPTLPS
jgi:hypothetical protein